jgi:hypothetical protein
MRFAWWRQILVFNVPDPSLLRIPCPIHPAADANGSWNVSSWTSAVTPKLTPTLFELLASFVGCGVDSLQAWVEPERHSLCSAALQPAGTSYPACREEANEASERPKTKKKSIFLRCECPRFPVATSLPRSFSATRWILTSHALSFFLSRMDPFLNPPAVDSDPLLDPPKGI